MEIEVLEDETEEWNREGCRTRRVCPPRGIPTPPCEHSELPVGDAEGNIYPYSELMTKTYRVRDLRTDTAGLDPIWY